ncbi:hypothetical protein [Altererythrobacter lutimaris]|nr:hypothetical protein [Altererythrobacter lutimaris]
MFWRAMRLLLQALGLALCLSGGLWTLQGFGIVQWPANSFMLGETQWALRGMIAFAIGGILIWLGFRKS